MHRFIIEFGTGIDLHGIDPTKAAKRAIEDAIHHSCLCGLQECLRIEEFSTVSIGVKIACPYPDRIDEDAIRALFSFGSVTLDCTYGGLLTDGAYDETLGKCGDIIVAVVSLTVYISQHI